MLGALAPTVFAWWRVADLTDRVATEPLTTFDPEALALTLIGVVVVASIASFYGLLRVFRGDAATVYWTATVVVWAASLGLGLVTSVVVG